MKEHAPHQRAGWTGSGMYSFDTQSAQEERRKREEEALTALAAVDDASSASRAERDRRQTIADAALRAVSDPGLLLLSRKNLEPDSWWLNERPGSSSSSSGGSGSGETTTLSAGTAPVALPFMEDLRARVAGKKERRKPAFAAPDADSKYAPLHHTPKPKSVWDAASEGDEDEAGGSDSGSGSESDGEDEGA